MKIGMMYDYVTANNESQDLDRDKKPFFKNKLIFFYLQQFCGSGSVLDPYSGASWIRFRNTDPDPHMQVQVKMEAKDVRLKILINNSETQLIKNFFR